MIRIIDKADCCGCQACAEKCPKKCISLYEDCEGFLYPKVDETLCVNCHLCERVCPIINKEEEREPLTVYAAINPNNEIRNESSSGGVFTTAAESIIKQGGVVFGAKWNKEWGVEHGHTESLDGLCVFRGSKYVQSNVNGSYSKVEALLKAGRKVLFSGTPCQIAGLRHFLHKDYENLLLVDCICHGVPSPGVFRQYIQEQNDLLHRGVFGNKRQISQNAPYILTNIAFRDKRYGWSNYHCTFTYASSEDTIHLSTPNMENEFFRGFNSDLYSRPSCNVCVFRGLRSGSDITFGDFWGIGEVMPEIDDDKGVSAVIINSLKGEAFFKTLDLRIEKTSYDVICKYNHSVVRSDPPNSHRADFFSHSAMSVHQRVNKYCRPTKSRKFLSKIKRVVLTLLQKGQE